MSYPNKLFYGYIAVPRCQKGIQSIPFFWGL